MRPVRYGKTVLAPHVVGYLSGDGINGAAGIEQAYNDWLNACGGEATVTYSADAMGKPLQDTDPKLVNTLDNAKAGVVLTLDADIQKITERVAKNYIQKGAVLVMEPSSGQILSMVSLPDYQPDTVAESLENEDSPLLNRALCNYNCGSVFKIVSAAAALEAGVSTEYSYTCTGKYSIEELNFHCHNRLGHGQLNMLQAFGKSCNPYFINLMQQVGGEKLYDMAVTLGFDRPIVLAEGLKTAGPCFLRKKTCVPRQRWPISPLVKAPFWRHPCIWPNWWARWSTAGNWCAPPCTGEPWIRTAYSRKRRLRRLSTHFQKTRPPSYAR